MTRKPDQKPGAPAHISDEQILAYLDGELSPAERQRVGAHLEGCWTCRSTMGELQARIGSFVQFRKDLLPAPDVFDEMRLEQFRQRLARHAKESEAPASWWPSRSAEFGAWWQKYFSGSVAVLARHQRATLAVVLSICLVVVMFTDVLNTRVSADTVLRRAESYESHLAPATDQVTRSSVHVERVDHRSGVTKDLGTLAIMRESRAEVAYVSASSASGQMITHEIKSPEEATAVMNGVLQQDGEKSSLVEYLAGRQWVPDVSPSGFRKLLEGREREDSSARRDGGEFELHYPFAAGHKSGISEALLRVNAENYAPESISLFTDSAQQEYRFTRTAFTFRPRAIELASLNVPADVAVALGSRTSNQQPRQVVPLSYENSRATEGEVLAAAALHQVESCLGEEVYVYPMSDGTLLVQGLVETPSRREAIRGSLKTVAGDVRSEVFLPTEVKSGKRLYDPPDQTPDDKKAGSAPAVNVTLADGSGEKIPLYDNLYRHFSQPGADRETADKQVLVFSNEIITLARQTFLHAWALKKLDREFSSVRTAGLSPEALKKIDDMQNSHRQSIATLARRQQALLSQVVDPGLVGNAAQLASAQPGEDLLLMAREQNDLVRALFTPSSNAQDANANFTKLLVLLRQMGA